jgi:hypothetical protein
MPPTAMPSADVVFETLFAYQRSAFKSDYRGVTAIAGDFTGRHREVAVPLSAVFASCAITSRWSACSKSPPAAIS